MSYSFNWSLFHTLPIVGILRGFEQDLTEELVDVAAKNGLTTLEVTMNTPGVEAQIAALADTHGGQMNIGAGTVTTLDEFRRARSAGASFIVTPVVVPEVIAACRQEGIPVFPGAYTPSEIFQAWQAGADMVKLFPASELGPSFVKAFRGPFPKIKLLATGGVGLDNIASYLDLGVEGFGIGSPLFQTQRMHSRDWSWLREQLNAFKALFASRHQNPAVPR